MEDEPNATQPLLNHSSLSTSVPPYNTHPPECSFCHSICTHRHSTPCQQLFMEIIQAYLTEILRTLTPLHFLQQFAYHPHQPSTCAEAPIIPSQAQQPPTSGVSWIKYSIFYDSQWRQRESMVAEVTINSQQEDD